MQATAETDRTAAPPAIWGWLALSILLVALWFPVARSLWSDWQSSEALSHGPLVPLIAAALAWARRDRLREWQAHSPAGFAVLSVCALLAVGSVWADIAFLKPLALVGVLLGLAWFLGGRRAAVVLAGPLGFLVFMIPWPTVLVDRIAFPLQLMSSAYAALIGGLMGIPVVRDGIQLAVAGSPGQPPVYRMVVAQACSGMTSLTVLLALGYLVAYHTEVALGWRAVMLAGVVPLALLTNATRLTFILVAGAHHRPMLAQWIHDHEGPVLILVCSLVLVGGRALLLRCAHARGGPGRSDPPPALEVPGDVVEAIPTATR